MKRLALAVSLFVLGLALAGCAGGGPHSSRVVLVQLKNSPGHSGFLSATLLAFYTSGSSGCPSVPDTLTVKTPHNIRLDLTTGSYRQGRLGQTVLVAKPPPGDYCVANRTLALVVIAINPKQIDVHHRLKISLYYPLDKHPDVFTVQPL